MAWSKLTGHFLVREPVVHRYPDGHWQEAEEADREREYQFFSTVEGHLHHSFMFHEVMIALAKCQVCDGQVKIR